MLRKKDKKQKNCQGHHYSAIIIDDLVREATSEKERDYIQRWCRSYKKKEKKRRRKR